MPRYARSLKHREKERERAGEPQLRAQDISEVSVMPERSNRKRKGREAQGNGRRRRRKVQGREGKAKRRKKKKKKKRQNRAFEDSIEEPMSSEPFRRVSRACDFLPRYIFISAIALSLSPPPL